MNTSKVKAKKPAELAKAYQPKVAKEWHYQRQLWQARLAPDGKTLLAAGYDATLQRWRMENLEIKGMSPLKGHDGWVQGIAIHPTQPWLYSADSWGRLCCWRYDQPEGKLLWRVDAAHPAWIRDVAVSRDGKWLATCGDGGIVKVWDPNNGKPRRTLQHHSVNVLSLLFHPLENLLVSADLKGQVKASAPGTGKLMRSFDASWLYQHHRIQHCGGVRCMTLTADGKLLVCGGQKTPVGGFANGTPGVVSFNWSDGAKKKEMAIGGSGDGFVYDLQFHPDGFLIGVTCAFPGKGHLWFWRPDDSKPFLSDSKLANGRSIALHSGGKRATLLTSDSANANGRQLKGGQYKGGRAKLRILELGG